MGYAQNISDPALIRASDFNYELPNERIAFKPMPVRHGSRLLFWQHGVIRDKQFKDIHQFLPENSLLVFNNTKVIAARMFFKKKTGGQIELFLLEPANGVLPGIALQQIGESNWNCMVGGVKKWKNDEPIFALVEIQGKYIEVAARLNGKQGNYFNVCFQWNAQVSFSEIIEYTGKIPLPPYIKRDASVDDINRYQTIYAKHEGSVAAPTAGLHFTEEVFKSLSEKNIAVDNLTLHVGAGTFKPVTAETIADHEMHEEFIEVDRSLIEKLISNKGITTAVGTTSLRTLESLYWLGVKYYHEKPIISTHLHLKQWENLSLQSQFTMSKEEALTSLLDYMNTRSINKLIGSTGICITPGYQFKVANALITNFHQPQSTLLLIIAAIAGHEWKNIYSHALQNEYRFLSYGDSSLLYINEEN